MTAPKRRKTKPAMHGGAMPTSVTVPLSQFPDAVAAINATFGKRAREFVEWLARSAAVHLPLAQAERQRPDALKVAIERVDNIAANANAMLGDLKELGNVEFRALLDADRTLASEPTGEQRDDPSYAWDPRPFETWQLHRELRRIRGAAMLARGRLRRQRTATTKTPVPPSLVSFAQGIANAMQSEGTRPSRSADGPFIAILELALAMAKRQHESLDFAADTLAKIVAKASSEKAANLPRPD